MRRSALNAAAFVVGLGIAAAGCGGDTGTTSSPSTTGSSTGDSSDPLAAGKAVFLGDSGCAGCHTLADAQSSGTVASDLDATKPTVARVQDVVANGTGAMQSYRKTLTPQQISDVAAYVASAASR
jgi:mono/diheme cytochrome c family protein